MKTQTPTDSDFLREMAEYMMLKARPVYAGALRGIADRIEAKDAAANALEEALKDIKKTVEDLLSESERAIEDPDERQHLTLKQWEGRKSALVALHCLTDHNNSLATFAALKGVR